MLYVGGVAKVIEVVVIVHKRREGERKLCCSDVDVEVLEKEWRCC